MRDRFLVVLITVAVVSIGWSLYTGGIRGQRDAAAALASRRSELIVIAETETETAYADLAATVESGRVIAAAVRDSAGILSGQLKSERARIRSLTSIIAAFDTVETGGVATDTVYVVEEGEDPIQEIRFLADSLGVRVEGWTRSTKPPTFNLSIAREPLRIQVVLSELKGGIWDTRAVVPSYVDLGSLDTIVRPLKPNFFQRHGFKIGLGIGVAAVLLLGG